MKRKKIIINGNDFKTKDGTAIRDFMHVSDHCRYTHHFCKIFKNFYQIFIIVVMDKDIRLKQVITEMEHIIKNKLKVEIGPRREKDISVSIANSDKFKKNLIGNQNLIFKLYFKNSFGII